MPGSSRLLLPHWPWPWGWALFTHSFFSLPLPESVTCDSLHSAVSELHTSMVSILLVFIHPYLHLDTLSSASLCVSHSCPWKLSSAFMLAPSVIQPGGVCVLPGLFTHLMEGQGNRSKWWTVSALGVSGLWLSVVSQCRSLLTPNLAHPKQG